MLAARLPASALGAAFAATARLRSGRPVHTTGLAFRGELELQAGAGLDLLPGWGAPRRTPAVVRLSRAFALPQAVWDVLGVAVKLPELHAGGPEQDLLLASALPGPAAVVPVPAPSYAHGTYSGLLPFRTAEGRRVLLGARSLTGAAAAVEGTELDGARAALAAGRLAFELLVAPLGGRWRALGALALREELDPREEAVLRYDPFHTGGGLEPVGLLNALRGPSYRSAQAARPQLRERRPVGELGR